ncbi:MAG: HAD family hydrolase [Bacteroidaceae bacterium]|nr:HAD family hydrolase [Bacteroidaceae bacterium]
MSKPTIYFDLFDTLVKVDRGYLEPYFDRETDRLGDLGKLPDAETTIWRLATQTPGIMEHGSIFEMAGYYEAKMKEALMNPPQEVLDMLKQLKEAGCKLCVISDAAPVDIMHWHESPLAQYFDDAVFSCEVGIVKPDAGLYHIAHLKMGKPTEMLYVGDGGHDELMGAHKFGMVTAKAEWINNRRLESIYQYANCRLQSPSQVLDIVQEMERLSNDKDAYNPEKTEKPLEEVL